MNRWAKVIQLGVVSLLFSFGFGLILFLLPLVAYGLSSSVAVVGVLVAVPALASLLAAIPVGWLVDSYGRRLVFYPGILAMVVVVTCLPTVSTISAFLLVVCFFGLGFQMVYGSLKTCLLELLPPKESSKFFGLVATGVQAGLALGPLAGGFLLADGLEQGVLSAAKLFTLDFLVVMLLVAAFGLAGAPARKPHFLRKSLFSGIGEIVKLRRVGVVVLWLTVLFTGYEGVVWALEPLFGVRLGMDASTAGMILSLFILPFIFFSLPAGLIADRFGKVPVLALGLMASGVFMLFFGMVENVFLLAVCAFLSAMGLAFAWTAMAGLLADASAGFQKGGIVGVWNTSEELGYLAGPVLGGLFAQSFTLKMPFALVGILLLVSVVPVLSLVKKLK